jgi:hypothetical protein
MFIEKLSFFYKQFTHNIHNNIKNIIHRYYYFNQDVKQILYTNPNRKNGLDLLYRKQ